MNFNPRPSSVRICANRFLLTSMITFAVLNIHVTADESLAEGVLLTGKVVLPDGKPAVGAVVRISGTLAKQTATAETGSDGRYRLRVENRHVQKLFARSASGDLIGFIDVQSDTGKTDQPRQVKDISLGAANVIAVSVVDDSHNPVQNATVIAQVDFGILEQLKTDEHGMAQVEYPKGLSLQVVGAVKARTGCDYRIFEARKFKANPANPGPLPLGFTGELKLTLNGVRQARVKILGPDNEPLAGIPLDPWLIRKPGHGDSWNLPGLSEFRRETDERGLATFDMLPADQENSIEFWPRLDRNDWFVVGNGDHGNDSAFVRWEKSNSATIQVLEKVPVGGRIVDAGGKPVSGILVRAAAGFKYTSWFHQTAKSDEDGRWQMLVKPDGYYLFVVQNEKSAALPQAGILVRETDTPMDLDFELQPARRVFGKVSGKIDAQTTIMLQQVAPDYYKLPKNQRLPNPGDSNRAVSAFTQDVRTVNADGSYEFKVGPGDFVIWSPDQKTQKFTITSDKEVEFNFDLKRAVRGPVKITVVDANENKPIANANVYGRSISGVRGWINGSTGSDGVLASERDLVDMLVLVETPDKQLAGISKLKADDTELTIKANPSAKANGRLVDANQQPVANARLEYGIKLTFKNGTMSKMSVSRTTTDSDGLFLLDGLCFGREYTVDMVVATNADGIPRSWRTVALVTAEAPDIDLGEVQIKSR